MAEVARDEQVDIGFCPPVENVNHTWQNHVGDLGLHLNLTLRIEDPHVVTVFNAAFTGILRMQTYHGFGLELVEPRNLAKLGVSVERQARSGVEHQGIRFVLFRGVERRVYGFLIHRQALETIALENLGVEFNLARWSVEPGFAVFANLALQVLPLFVGLGHIDAVFDMLAQVI